MVTVLIGHEEAERCADSGSSRDTACGRSGTGDRGAVCGRDGSRALHLDLWLMSCRVLKRDMEYAMMDVLVETCKARGIRRIYGYYYPTAKNGMVRDFYGLQGFEKLRENEQETVWRFDIPDNYEKKNHYIEIEK